MEPMSMSPEAVADTCLDAELAPQASGLRDVRAGRATVLAHQVRFYTRLDDAISRQPAVPSQTIACKSGCSYCCHYHVYVYAPEALAIAEHLASSPAAFRDSAVAKLRANAEQVASLGLERHMVTNIACAFLRDDQSCGIYAVRPSACRRHHSMDVTVCKTTFDDPTATDLSSQSALILGASDGMVLASAVVMHKEGFDFARYEMTGAVLEALTNRSSLRRWKDGKRSFPTVRDSDDTGGLPEH